MCHWILHEILVPFPLSHSLPYLLPSLPSPSFLSLRLSLPTLSLLSLPLSLLSLPLSLLSGLNSYLLFPTLTDMRQISLDVPFYADLVLPISRVSDTASADVDLRTDEVYWTNGLDAAIYKSPIGGGPSVTVIKSGLVSPRSVSVDWIGGTLYWLDSGRRRIEVAHLNGSNRRALVYTNLVTPNGLAIDVESQ